MSARDYHGGHTVKPLSPSCQKALAFMERQESFTIEDGGHAELRDALDTLFNRDLVHRVKRQSAGRTYWHYEIARPLPVFVSNGPKVNYAAIKGRDVRGFAALQKGEEARAERAIGGAV